MIIKNNINNVFFYKLVTFKAFLMFVEKFYGKKCKIKNIFLDYKNITVKIVCKNKKYFLKYFII